MKRTNPFREIVLLWLLALFVAVSARAAIPSVDPATLVPTAEQKRATAIILDLIRKYHYKKVPLNDDLSSAILDRYLKNLDPSRSFFLSEDIAEFEAYRDRLDDALEYRQLEPAFVMFRRFRERMGERTDFAIEVLGRGFDFTRDEEFVFDRSDQPWARSAGELNELWRQRVKNDVLILRLQEMDEKKISETLVRRYRRANRRVRQLNRNDVYQFFINAYTVSIEPHTAYFSPRTSENFKIRMSLSLEGIGAALQTENEYTVVRRIIAGGPADLSGSLRVDDRIVGVGQGLRDEIVDVVSWRLEDVVDLIRGPKSSIVRLQILGKDAGLSGPRETITLVRDKIKLEEQAAKRSIEEATIGGAVTRIGVIDVPTFYLDSAARARGDPDYRSTTRDVRRLISELVSEGVSGIVIDLRGDSGGSLVEATELTGLFIKSGPVVQLRDSSGRIQINRDPDPKIAYAGPIAVLVDRRSASASEIFAGAIQDYRRGVIIGEPTFGKGTVQNLVDLDRRGRLGQLKVTIAQFFRINGAGTQYRGVIPDIIFPTAVDSEDQGERGLENALPWATVRPARYLPYASLDEAIERARILHEARVKTDPGFQFLLKEAEIQRKARQRQRVSLVEKRRREEFEATRKARQERTNRYRVALGLPPLEGNEKAAADEPEPKDVRLSEAAQILADIIRSSWRSSAMLD